MADFKDLIELAELMTFVGEAGFRKPTPVQSETIPRFLRGESLSVLAQTGSGKTLAFALPLVQLIKQGEVDRGGDLQEDRAPVGWVVAPTDELCTQLSQVFKALAHKAKFRVRVFKKGRSKKETRMSVSGAIDIVIGTPGRILSGLEAGLLRTDQARYLIMDEADQLFDPGFVGEVRTLATKLFSPQLQVGLFSATMPGSFAERRALCFPRVRFEEISLQGSHSLRDNIETINLNVPFVEKTAHAIDILRKA